MFGSEFLAHGVWLFGDGAMQGQELGSMILLGDFQLRVFYDSIILLTFSLGWLLSVSFP